MLDFKLRDESQKRDVTVHIKSRVDLDTLPKQNKETGVGEENKLIMQRIVADAFPYLKGKNDFDITITKIDKDTNEIDYYIEGELGAPIHHMGIRVFEPLDTDGIKSAKLKEVINKIVDYKIQATGNTAATVGLKTLLSRFSQTDPMPTGFFARIRHVIAKFFEMVREQFTIIDRIWEGITGQSVNELKWDLNILAEVCGTPPTQNISLHESLKYIDKLMKREQGVADDKELEKRLQAAIDASESQINLRNKFSVGGLEKQSKEILRSIDNLAVNKKLLLPVGYYDNGVLKEMLLEIEKNQSGKFTVSLISASSEMREYFDRENSIKGGKQAIRRDILNVDRNDLEARIPLMLELSTSPSCSVKDITHPWRALFFDSLKFPDSTVDLSKLTEKFSKTNTTGHIREAIAYLEQSQGNSEEAKRFDLSIRLRLFLDVCNHNKKSWADPEFWNMVKTTTNELAKEIEANKALIGGEKAQGKELTAIHKELKTIMDKLDANPPKSLDPRKEKLGSISGKVIVSAEPEIPMVTLASFKLSEFEEVNPPFSLFDPLNNGASFDKLIIRFGELKENNLLQKASAESKLIVRSLPSIQDPFWKTLTNEEFSKFTTTVNTLAEALKGGIEENEDATLEEMLAITTLSYYGYHISTMHGVKWGLTETLKTDTDAFADELAKCRLLPIDKEKLMILKNLTIQPIKPLGIVVNYSALGSGFEDIREINEIANKGTPIFLQHPDYAEKIASDITNRYITQQCPLGCDLDNCVNYARVDKAEHRFHPLFMVHNFVDIFAEKSIDAGLTRDESIDLMYTQTTHQSANDLIVYKHNNMHGSTFAHGFDREDRKCQVMLTWMAFMQHPDFFKSPDLRWHFETKLFTEEAFGSILDQEHLPFVQNMLKQLTKEIKIAYSANEIEKCAYLAHVETKLRTLIVLNKTLEVQTKENLLALLIPDTRELLQKLFKEFIHVDEPHSVEKQRMVFTLCMDAYYEKFCNDPNDPALNNQADLINMIAMSHRLQMMKGGFDKVDPEFRDRYTTLLALIHPRIQNICETEKSKGAFANAVLTLINPDVAAKRLAWELKGYPILSATAKDGKGYLYNLASREVTIQGQLARTLPALITNNPEMQRLFGSTLKDSWATRGVPEGLGVDNTIVYVHSAFPKFRILFKKDPGQKPTAIVERTVKNPYGKDEWVSYVRFNEQQRVVEGQEILVPDDLPTEVAAAIGDRQCFVNKKKERIYVMEGKSDTPYAVITLKNVNVNGVVETEVSDMRFTDGDRHLLDPKSRAMECFTTIELPEFLQVTGKKNVPADVEYQRYLLAGTGAKLKYKMDEKGMHSQTFPGFDLAPLGKRPGINDPSFGAQPLPTTFKAYQLLQKGGVEKVLIPMREFEQQFNIKGESLPSSNIQYPHDYSTCNLYEYKVDTESNRLVAESADAYGYLAYACLTHDDYGSARFYLDKARTSSGYGDSNTQIMKWLANWKDDSPNGVALKLHFALLQEEIIDDKRNSFIVKGELKKIEDLDFDRSVRLGNIASQYELYMKASPLKQVEPVLNLSAGQHIQTQKLLKELIAKHGKDKIVSGEAVPVRAISIPQQVYLHADTKDPLVYQKEAILLWSLRIGEKGMSPATLKDPLWVVQNFQSIFNEILAKDLSSAEVKKLILQIELVSKLPLDSLDEVQQESVKIAQSYLLKLITAKRDFPDIYSQFQPKLEDGILPSFSGPWFTSSRVNMVKMTTEASDLGIYTADGMKDPKVALTELMKNVPNAPFEMRMALRGLETFILQYKGQEKDFYRDYRFQLLERFYGSSAAKSIEVIDEVLKVLEPLPISTASQAIAKAPKKPVAKAETYEDRYTSLLKAHIPENSAKEIEALELSLFSGVEPPRPNRVVTPAQNLTFVLGKEITDQCTNGNILKVDTNPHVAIRRELFDSLKNSDEPSIARNAAEHEKDMEKALLDKKDVQINRGGVNEMIKILEAKSEKSEKKQEVLRSDLMQFIDRFETEAGILAMQRLTGKAVKPNLDTLISLWRRGEIKVDFKNSILKEMGLKNMTLQVLEEFDGNIQDYLVLVTENRHLKRTLKMAEDYKLTCGKKDGDIGDKPLAIELYDSLQTKRYYHIADSDVREMLFMEYSQGLILREGQVSTYREMISVPNAVRQLQMGGGKSKVLLPLLAKQMANGQNLVMLILPDELYETNCRDLDKTNRMLFGQTMHRFEFSRITEKNLEALHLQHIRLLKTIENKGFVMSTKRSMLSFRNAYVEKLTLLQSVNAEKEKGDLIAEIREMNSILTLFRDHTDMLADEVDACLDVRKEVNFSLGKGTPIDPIKAEVGIKMMEIVLKATKGSVLEKLKIGLLDNTQGSLSQDNLNLCMEKIAEKYRQQLNLKFEKKQFAHYMMDRPDGKDVEAEVNDLKEINEPLYRQITALKGLINNGFGSTFKRVGRVNYGRDPVSQKWTIPYKASNEPHIGSEFDDEIERIAFTVQDYLQFGVQYKPVYQAIVELQTRAIQELRVAKEDSTIIMGLNDTIAAKEFEVLLKKLDKEGKFGNLTLSAIANPSRIEALVAGINESPEARLAFVAEFVLKEMEQTNVQINAASADLPALGRGFSGFSGTPWNLHTYHDKIDGIKNLGVDGRTWALMLSREIPIKTFEFNAKDPAGSILSELQMIGNQQALIDTGAYLRGISNEVFINKVMEKAKKNGIELQGANYFDESGRIVKKTSLDDPALPIESAKETDLMYTFTLYDQAHTVGADIQQGKKATAIVTIGENTFIRDLFQAVWRLRQLDREQKFMVAVSDQIKERILNGEDRDLTMEDILKYCLSNEAKRESEDNFRAERSKIQGTAKNTALNTVIDLIDQGINDEKIVELTGMLVSKDAGLLVKERIGDASFDSYATIKSKEPASEQLDKLKKTEAKRCLNLAFDLKEVNTFAAEALKDASQNLLDRPDRPADWMPKLVNSSPEKGGGEVELEAQAEVEAELELSTEALAEQETVREKEVVIMMVQSGQAGSGSVHSITSRNLNEFITPPVNQFSSFNNNSLNFRRLANVCSFFDQEIYATEVFERNLPSEQVRNPSPRSLFYTTRKTPNTALIVKDANGKFKTVIPTVHEVHAACREFVKNYKGEAAVVSITPGEPLIFYKSGVDRSAGLPFVNEADKKEFYRQYIQLKLFNGEIEFGSEDEKEALTLWLLKKDVKDFKSYFEKHILSTKPSRFAKSYSSSTLYKIFEELLQPRAFEV